MRTFKKIIRSAVLSLIILSLTVIPSFSADAPTIEVGSVTAEAGTVVEVPVSFTGNPGICSFTLAFTYDPDVLTLESVKPSDEIGGNFAFGKRAVWIASGDVKADGVFLTLRFKIDHYVEAKDYSVGVVYNKGDICNYNEDDVDFETVSGRITVERLESFPVEDSETSAPVEVTSGETGEEDDDTTSDAAASDADTMPVPETTPIPETTGALNTADEPGYTDPDITSDPEGSETVSGGASSNPESASSSETVSDETSDQGGEGKGAPEAVLSAPAREILDSHSSSQITDAVESSLEDVGAGSISELTEDQKPEFINDIKKSLGIADEGGDGMTDEELLDVITELYGYLSASDNAESTADASADSADDGETVESGKKTVNGFAVAAIAAAVCAVTAVIIILISKKSKSLRK